MNISRLIRKRPFITFFCVLLVVTVTSGICLFSFGILGENANLPGIHVSSNETGSYVFGTGLNIKKIPVNNLLQNSSFEKTAVSEVFSIEGQTENSVFVLPENIENLYEQDDFFLGGTMRVMSFDEDSLSRKFQTTVTRYKTNQLGLWSKIELPWTVDQDFEVAAVAYSTNTTVAVGQKGAIISDIHAASPRLTSLASGKNLVDCAVYADRFFALAADGSIATSTDGRNWTEEEAVLLSDSSVLFSSLFFLDRSAVAVGSKGSIILYNESGGQVVSSGTSEHLRAITGNGRVVLVAGDNGTLLTSSNGTIFRALSEEEKKDIPDDVNWSSAYVKNNTFFLGGSNGGLSIGSFDDATGLFSFSYKPAQTSKGEAIDIAEIRKMNTGSLLLLSQSGRLYCSSDEGDSWLYLQLEKDLDSADLLSVSSSDKILLTSGRNGYSTQLYTEISFTSGTEAVEIEKGSMLFLEITKNTEGTNVENGAWEIGGEGSRAVCVNQAPTGGGATSLMLSGTAGEDAHHILSQKLSAEDYMPLKKSEFYRLDIWLRQENIKNGEVMVWFSGNFKTLGTTFTNVGGGWRKYSEVFFLSPDADLESFDEQRLNIAFKGDGSLYIDRVELKKNTTADQVFLEPFISGMKSAKPQYIRLESLQIGAENKKNDTWIAGDGNEGFFVLPDGEKTTMGMLDLSSSLQMVKEVGANPWIVIDSYTSAADMEAILAYMCGSITDDYGKIRFENGKATPWSREFDRIVFEFTDTNAVFLSDIQRSAFSAYMKTTIDSSAYFPDINDKVLFVDGMPYESKVMVSSADFHASSLFAQIKSGESGEKAPALFSAGIKNAYDAYLDKIPRILSNSLVVSESSIQGGNEWIYSSDLYYYRENDTGKKIRVPVTSAEYVSFWLYDLGSYTTSGIMADISVSSEKEAILGGAFFSDGDFLDAISVSNGETLLRSFSILENAGLGSPLGVNFIPSPSGSDEDPLSAEDALEGVMAFAFRSSVETSVVIANTSNETKTFRLESDEGLRGSSFFRYSSTGKLMDTGVLGRNQNRITLSPGEVVVVKTAA